MIKNPELPKVDRLSAFFRAFEFFVYLDADIAPTDCAVLIVESVAGEVRTVSLYPRGLTAAFESEKSLLRISIGFGGLSNPLLATLPTKISAENATFHEIRFLASLVVKEAHAERCGRSVGLSKLCEVIVLLMLRQAIDLGSTEPGLLAGLSHPSIRRALVSIHDEPARNWRTDDLARIAGLSRSQFMAVFLRIVGMTPSAYATGWRLDYASRELSRGTRPKAVALKAGFSSAEAFSRAYSRRFGHPPSERRNLSPPAARIPTG